MGARKISSSKLLKFGGLGAIALLLILGLVVIVSAQGENLLANPGFETPDPTNWQSKDTGFLPFWSYSWPTIPVHSGNRSIGISVNPIANMYEGWWESTPPVPITAGTPYTFSGWIKTQGVANQAFLSLIFIDAGGEEIMSRKSRDVNGSTDWTQVWPSVSVVAPEDAVYARIRCQLSGAGTAWCDDVLLRPVSIESPDLELQKSVQPATVNPGGQLTYTLRYGNIGRAEASSVVMTDTLPAGATVITSSRQAVWLDSRTLIWNVGDLGGGGNFDAITVVVTVSDTLAQGQWLTNMVTMTAQNAEKVTAQVSTQITSSPQLTITKISSADLVNLGDTMYYTLTCRNTGGAVAQNVWLTDTLPGDVEVVSVNPKGREHPDPRILVWDVGDLPANGEEKIYVITVTVRPSVSGPTLDNCAVLKDAAATSSAQSCVRSWVMRWFTYLPLSVRNYCRPLTNGGFENGWVGWTHGGVLAQSISSDGPHSGSASALLGHPDYGCVDSIPIGSAWVEQTISVPSVASPQLTFWYNIFTHDKNSSLDDTYDSFDVKINDNLVFRDMNEDGPNDCGNLRNLGWRQKTIDLSGYAGSSITLRFENWNRYDNWYNTYTYVDDVQLLLP